MYTVFFKLLGDEPVSVYFHLKMTFASLCYVAAKATYIRLLHGKISFLGSFFGPSSIKRGRTRIVLG